MENKKIICWWSGGITSAVACKLALEMFGIDNCRIVMIDTGNEDTDTYRFLVDCEKWYNKRIEIITAIKPETISHGLDVTFVDLGWEYTSIQDVWTRYKTLNAATGAICSTDLKRRVREKWQSTVKYDHQVFGFEFDKREFNRAMSLSKNHPKARGIYPLIMMGYDKEQCIQMVHDAGIEIPQMYKLGFKNNNCFQTGCVQGGMGYWQKIQREFPDKFNAMAEMEHRLTAMKGQPVTMLKDQRKDTKLLVQETGVPWLNLVFLKKHPDYPELKCLDDMGKQEVRPLFECNGFCGTNDLNPVSGTEFELNFAEE
jgi:hypothetical protein